MKARTLMIMTGAILALSASVAQASVQRMLPVKQGLAAHHKIAVKKTDKGHATTQPIYIYVASSGQPAPADSVDANAICPDGTTVEENCGYCN